MNEKLLGNDKKIYIWGLGVFGLALLSDLKKDGVNICGIIDRRSKELVYETPVYRDIPLYEDIEDIEDIGNLNNAYFIVTATTPPSIEQICKRIQDFGGIHTIIASGRKSVYIDISGVCNLRCKSCQVSNHDETMFDYHNRGFMKSELYEKIIKKVKRELPEVKCVFLYIFGEPLLNRNLPDIIKITHEQGLYAILSTNLSMEVELEKIIQANPDCIKISLSGYSQSIYSTTHNGGNIDLVKANMLKMKDYIKKNHASTSVIVGYHLYNNNLQEETQMKQLCSECDFLFQSSKAEYCNVFKKWGLAEFSTEDKKFIEQYYSNSKEILNKLPIKNKNASGCGYLDEGLFIDYNGDVILCCSVMHKDAVFGNYLSKDLDEINKSRKCSWICKACMEHGTNWG